MLFMLFQPLSMVWYGPEYFGERWPYQKKLDCECITYNFSSKQRKEKPAYINLYQQGSLEIMIVKQHTYVPVRA